MKNLYIIVESVKFIEENLCENITQEDIANNCFCSLSSLQKTFQYATHHSIKDYISKRRLTEAAKDLLNSDENITDIALKYQYGSPEVFTRAFVRVWGEKPSSFRKNRKFSQLFAPLDIETMVEKRKKGENYMSRKRTDLSELYQILKERSDNYIICADMIGLMEINEKIGRNAGDKAIAEAVRRMDEASTEDMLFFRIGGDEFVIVTNYTSADDAVKLAEKIVSQNGNTIDCDGVEVSVGLRTGITKISLNNTVRYAELFNRCMESIDFTRNSGKNVSIKL